MLARGVGNNDGDGAAAGGGGEAAAAGGAAGVAVGDAAGVVAGEVAFAAAGSRGAVETSEAAASQAFFGRKLRARAALTMRMVGSSLSGVNLTKSPSGKTSALMSRKRVSIFCSRHSWRTDSSVNLKLGMHLTFLRTITRHPLDALCTITGMSPMHVAVAMPPSAAENRSLQGRTLIRCFAEGVLEPVHPESG